VESIEILEERVRQAGLLIQQLREKNGRLQRELEKRLEENQHLDSENKQVQKLIAEIQRLKEDRELIKQKCTKLLKIYEKFNI
jgi:Tfp pilus assembly protein PilN